MNKKPSSPNKVISLFKQVKGKLNGAKSANIQYHNEVLDIFQKKTTTT
ncbi:hypothetical protein [Aquimarina sp. MMG016]|nr:hypothetical protein [Aquimarina sp. MMG016]MBQ4821998.1 hypothetical protein [Aquimarina sp. MMG016]